MTPSYEKVYSLDTKPPSTPLTMAQTGHSTHTNLNNLLPDKAKIVNLGTLQAVLQAIKECIAQAPEWQRTCSRGTQRNPPTATSNPQLTKTLQPSISLLRRTPNCSYRLYTSCYYAELNALPGTTPCTFKRIVCILQTTQRTPVPLWTS